MRPLAKWGLAVGMRMYKRSRRRHRGRLYQIEIPKAEVAKTIATACLLVHNVSEFTNYTSKSCTVQIRNVCGVIMSLIQSDPVQGALEKIYKSKSCTVQIGNMCGVTMIVVLVQSDPDLGAVEDPVSGNGSEGSFSMRRALWSSLTTLDYKIAEQLVREELDY